MSLLATGVTELLRFADYRGRSTRTHLAALWLVTIFGGSLLLILAGLLEYGVFPHAPLTTSAMIVCKLIWTIPMIALYVRRVHDQGRSGWWVALAVPMTLQNAFADYYRIIGDFDAALAMKASTLYLVAALPMAVVVAFLILPGEEGPNRYGPNPRYDPPREPA